MHKIDTIGAWLHITDKCNLKCTYCYFPHNPISMSVEVGKASIDILFNMAKKYHSSLVHIKYVGGEPLLEFKKLVTLARYANELSKSTDIEFNALIITNGILLDDTKLERIKALNIKLTISLDGLDDYNEERITVENESSTARVIEAIELAISHRIYPHISIVVGEKNIKGLPSFVKWLLEKNLKFNFTLVRKNNCSPEVKDFEEQKIIDGLFETFAVIKNNLPTYSIVGSISDKMNVMFAHNKTCGAGDNYLVFNTHGEISKCQMQMDKTISSYKSTDPIADIRKDTKFVRSFDVDEIEECKTCDIRYFCTGGCSMETYNKTGKYNQKSPNCKIYKAIYPELLKLEALRIMKFSYKYVT